jgi:hypothetical protein
LAPDKDNKVCRFSSIRFEKACKKMIVNTKILNTQAKVLMADKMEDNLFKIRSLPTRYVYKWWDLLGWFGEKHPQLLLIEQQFLEYAADKKTEFLTIYHSLNFEDKPLFHFAWVKLYRK